MTGAAVLPAGISWEQFLLAVAWYRRAASRDRSARRPARSRSRGALPGTRASDQARKQSDYARVGVGELPLIDPQAPAALVLRASSAAFVVVEDLDADGRLTSPRSPVSRSGSATSPDPDRQLGVDDSASSTYG